MSTIKDNYFKLKQLENEYLTPSVIKYLLIDANNFNNFSQLILHFDNNCLNEEKLFDNAKKVINGYPYQYVLGHVDFLDINIDICPEVLIPRQESEQLCLIAKEYIDNYFKDEQIDILDLCSGSGCLSLYLKSKFYNSNVLGVDIKKRCVDLANQNIKKLSLNNIKYIQKDIESFISNNTKKYDILICNPPYIKDKSSVDKQVLKYEPHDALFASPNYYFYELILSNYEKLFNDKFLIFFEIDEDLQQDLTNLINIYLKDNCTFIFKKDLYNKTRFLIIYKV